MEGKTKFSATLLAIVSVSLATPAAADTAIAAADTIVSTAAVVVDTDSVSRKRAAKAINAAAVEAAEAVLADTKLDLDIRLIGPTSVKIAGDR